jgi:hypothetical protein
MDAVGSSAAARGADAERRAIIVASDGSIEGQGVFDVLRNTPIAADACLDQITIAELWRRRRFGADDLLLVVADRAPDARMLENLARLARGSTVALVVPAEWLAIGETLEAARSVGLVAREGLGPKVLETALRALLRARRNERRLLKTLAARNAALAEMRIVAADLELSVEALSSRAPNEPASAAESLADEAIEALAEASARIGIAMAEADCDRPADLVRLVDSRVRRDGHEWDPHVFALMSEDPIWLGSSERLIGSMLDELFTRWRGARGAGDRLELIVWDAGDSARIAAVFSRVPGSEWSASLAWLVGDLIGRVRPLARAAGARIEAPCFASEDSERASFTLWVPKRSIARPIARSPRPDVNGDLVNHGGD